MESQKYTCPKCNKEIYQMNSVLHELQCQQNSQQNSRQNSQQSQDFIIKEENNYSNNVSRQQSKNSNSFEYQPDISNYPQVPQQYKKEIFKKPSLIKPDPHPNNIICPKCTLPLKINQIENHMNNCQYSTCRYCQEYYPNSIINEHKQNCIQNVTNRTISSQPSRQFSNENSQNFSFQQQNNQQNPFLDNHTNQQNRNFFEVIPNQSNQNSFQDRYSQSQSQQNSQQSDSNNPFITLRVVHRTPFGIIQTLERVRPNQVQSNQIPLYQENLPLFNEQRNQQQQRRNIFDLFEMNDVDDEFFQRTNNHNNFMRQNRFLLLNPENLIRIIEQLQNPNRGMNQNQINNIQKIKYHKPNNVIQGEEDKCPICINEYNENEEIRELPCKHIFHPECIDTWLVQNSKCPVCKSDLLQRNSQNQ